MKKIMILANHVLGLYSFRRELIIELLNKNFEVILSAPYDDKITYFTGLGCIFIETPVDRRGVNIKNDVKLLIKYWKMIKIHQPSVVLTYTIKPNIYGGIVCGLNNIPYITNITGLGSAVENKSLLKRITINLYRIGLRKSKRVLFQNNGNMKFMHSHRIALKNSLLIPGSGVNLNHYKLLEYPNDRVINFLFISRIMKEKGIEQYLETAKFIKSKYPNTNFHVLGNCNDNYINKLKEYEDKGFIKYHGRQDDVREFHKISHCTIHPSYYPEGMSNVLLESAACGRPIITTNRCGCKEVVDDGINGYLVEQKNTQDLIEKVERFINLDNEARKQMGLAGRKKVEREFDRKIVVGAYLEEIKGVVG
ncbi:MAG TPA: glycosyltransferase family 4 protein [Gallicola sp.]|nr:glycosyltransferase family 4 protein [Gallicola sp.]